MFVRGSHFFTTSPRSITENSETENTLLGFCWVLFCGLTRQERIKWGKQGKTRLKRAVLGFLYNAINFEKNSRQARKK